MKSAHNLHTPMLTKFIRTMNRQILIDDVRMDTQTAFFMNGDIKVYPCSYEQDKAPVTRDGKASYRGRITVMEDGNTSVKAYNEGTGPRYKTLFTTEHCTVQQTQGGCIIVKWNFRRRMNSTDIREAMERETPMITGFFRSRKEETVW